MLGYFFKAKSLTVFTLLITSSCFAGQSFASALAFAKTALAEGHQIKQIFLYEDAVSAAAPDIDLPSDEPDLSQLLNDFCLQQQIPLLLCVTAAEKRGIPAPVNSQSSYTFAGLAEFAMQLDSCDKLVQF